MNDGPTTLLVTVDDGTFDPQDATVPMIEIAPGEVAFVAGHHGFGIDACPVRLPPLNALAVRRAGSTTVTTIDAADPRWDSRGSDCHSVSSCSSRDFTLHLRDEDVAP